MNAKDFFEEFGRILREYRIAFTNYPVKGVYPYLERGAAIFKKIRYFIEKVHDEDHNQVLFPTLIPLSLFKKETDFFKGFTPEAYVVTETLQGKKFDEKLILRPTSEVPLYYTYSFLIQSHRDLPVKIYQIVNIFRCETKMTFPLLRLREVPGFVEAHTFHKNEEESHKQIKDAIKLYKRILKFVNLPWILVKCPEWDLFPGAYYQYDFITILPNGKLVELASIINLGQKFSKAFDIKFQDRDLKWKHVYQTCYGIGIDRMIGSLVAIFYNDGLQFPLEVAPEDYVIVPIVNEENKEKVFEYCKKVNNHLKEQGYKGIVDFSDDTPGSKFYKYERLGVPIRIEIGEKELKDGKVTIKVRGTKEKFFESIENFNSLYKKIKENLAKHLLKEAVNKIDSIKNDKFYLIQLHNPTREEIEEKEKELGLEYIGKVEESNFFEVDGEYYLFGKKY